MPMQFHQPARIISPSNKYDLSGKFNIKSWKDIVYDSDRLRMVAENQQSRQQSAKRKNEAMIQNNE